MIKLIEYLESREINHETSGKNIGRGWIGIEICPFCGADNFHFGINEISQFSKCFVCLEKVNIYHFIKRIENCDDYKTKQILKEFRDNNFQYQEKFEKQTRFIKNILPSEAIKDFLNIHIKYLESRGFNARKIIKEYKLFSCHDVGNYKFKIIAPIYHNKQIVNFVAINTSNKSNIKYKFLSNEKSNIKIGNCLYNIDNIKDKIIITEGIIDCWKIGKDAVCLFGKNLSDSQLKLISEKDINKAIIILDSDASIQADSIGNKLSGIIPHIEVIDLDNGDPGDLTMKEVRDMRLKFNF